jgi:hypothetical protein
LENLKPLLTKEFGLEPQRLAIQRIYGLGYVTGHGGQNFRNFLSHTTSVTAAAGNKNGYYTAFQNKLRNLSLSFE